MSESASGGGRRKSSKVRRGSGTFNDEFRARRHPAGARSDAAGSRDGARSLKAPIRISALRIAGETEKLIRTQKDLSAGDPRVLRPARLTYRQCARSMLFALAVEEETLMGLRRRPGAQYIRGAYGRESTES